MAFNTQQAKDWANKHVIPYVQKIQTGVYGDDIANASADLFGGQFPWNPADDKAVCDVLAEMPEWQQFEAWACEQGWPEDHYSLDFDEGQL